MEMKWNGDELVEWTMDTKEPVYQTMRKYFGEQIAKEIEARLCINSMWEGDPPEPEYKGDVGCVGVNDEHCMILQECADIARGKNDTR